MISATLLHCNLASLYIQRLGILWTSADAKLRLLASLSSQRLGILIAGSARSTAQGQRKTYKIFSGTTNPKPACAAVGIAFATTYVMWPIPSLGGAHLRLISSIYVECCVITVLADSEFSRKLPGIAPIDRTSFLTPRMRSAKPRDEIWCTLVRAGAAQQQPE